MNKHVLLKSHRIKRKYQPDWLTPQILDCIKERGNANKAAKWMSIDSLDINSLLWLTQRKINFIKQKMWNEKITHGLFGNYLSNLECKKKDLQKLIILKSRRIMILSQMT